MTGRLLAALLFLNGLALAQSSNAIEQLFDACENSDIAAVKTILASGADSNGRTHSGSTPIICASANGFLPMIKLLVQKGADVNAKGFRGTTALQSALLNAAEADCADCVKLLLTNGANVLARDKQGRTALHWAAIGNGSDSDQDFEGDPDLVQMLLKLGVDPKIKDRNGRTALDEALAHKRTAIIPLLRARS